MHRTLIASAAALALLSAGDSRAQNSPLSGLAPRGTVQASDIIPIMPAGGAQLMQTTVGAIIAPASAGATGTVQSVNLSLPGAFTCTGGPVTGSGTITCTLAGESANTFLAGPASGSAAPPTFRAIQIADLFGGAGASSSTFLRGDGTWAAAGAGSVTSVTCGAGLSGGVITASGTCSIPNSGVTAGSYSAANITVNAQGIVTAAANGSAGSPTCSQSGAVNSEGCLGAPLNAQTANYTLAAGDAAGLVNMACSAACTLTIPANASVAFPVGTIVDVTNLGVATDTIAITSDTLESGQNGSLVAGSVSLTVGGTYSLLKMGTATWLASGNQGAPARYCLPIYTVAGSSTAAVTFSNFPAGYNNLIIKLTARVLDTSDSSGGGAFFVQFNGDTTTGHYTSEQYSQAIGSSAAQGTVSPNSNGHYGGSIPNSYSGNTQFGSGTIEVYNYNQSANVIPFEAHSYANATTGSSGVKVTRNGGTYVASAPINQVTITGYNNGLSASSNLAAGSFFEVCAEQ